MNRNTIIIWLVPIICAIALGSEQIDKFHTKIEKVSDSTNSDNYCFNIPDPAIPDIINIIPTYPIISLFSRISDTLLKWDWCVKKEVSPGFEDVLDMRIKSGDARLACPEEHKFFTEGCLPATFSGSTSNFEPGFYYEKNCNKEILQNMANQTQKFGEILVTFRLVPKYPILLPFVLFFAISAIWFGWLLLAKKLADEFKSSTNTKGRGKH